MEFTRRELAAAMALAGIEMEAQTESAGSLYIPKPHVAADRKLLQDFMDEFSFVELVTSSPDIRITHVPVWLERSAGPYGALHGHISRQNPQHKTIDERQSAVLVFRGPQAYISPTWYATMSNVPTWNFAVVHATGKLRPVADKKRLRELLARLIDKFEDYRNCAYDFSKVPDGVINGMIEGLIGFEMEVERLEGKFKLGQERSEADRASLLRHLKGAKVERSIQAYTAEFYERRG